jgi:hypothetical protein
MGFPSDHVGLLAKASESLRESLIENSELMAPAAKNVLFVMCTTQNGTEPFSLTSSNLKVNRSYLKLMADFALPPDVGPFFGKFSSDDLYKEIPNMSNAQVIN